VELLGCTDKVERGVVVCCGVEAIDSKPGGAEEGFGIPEVVLVAAAVVTGCRDCRTSLRRAVMVEC
jgi:hypothetical protein